MICRHCDQDNPAGAAVCTGCGMPLDAICPQCRHECPAGATFCSWCGSLLRQAPAARADGGERKQATVLFADIVDSTQMVAGLDAEEAMGRLRTLLAAMSAAARRFGGTVLHSLGDGLKIIFGAPRAQEGHALLACQAALAMQEAVRRVPDAPAIRIGLHSGEVIAGEMDTGSAVEQEAQGLTVHIASRIQQLAAPGEICISDACQKLVRAFCDTLPTELRVLRGVPAPMLVHRLNGVRRAVASEQFRNAELTVLQGRDGELAELDRALGEALRGEPKVIGIAAPAGVGKSRLCFEFGERCRRRSVYVLEGRCFVHGAASPMLPIIEMLRTYFRVGPLDAPAEARRKVEQKLQVLDPALLNELPLILGFLGVRAPSDPPAASDPREAHGRLCRVLSEMTKAAGREPGVIIFEDLHWIDPASATLLNAFIEAAANTQILFVLNFRPSFRARWMETSRYREIVLRELDRRDSEAIVRELLGGAPELAAIRGRIAAQCDGNPFFAEELVRSLAETGVIEGTRGQYRRGPAPPGAILPPKVEAVIGARIDRLPEDAKALLQVGATIGKEFPAALLREISSVPRERMAMLLDQLRDAELIQERSGMLGPGYGFRHPLIQEVAYTMQLRTRRRRLHAEVAEAIGKLPWGMLDEVAGDLAHHSEAAGDMLAAAKHLRRCALWTNRTDATQALQQWKKVYRLLCTVPPSPEIERLRAEACGAVLGTGWRTGISVAEARPYAEEALHYARKSTDPLHGPLLRIAYGRIVVAGGPADEYVELSREALLHHDVAENPSLHALLRGAHAQALFLSGRLREALRAVESGTELLRPVRSSAAHHEQAAYLRGRVGFDVGHWLAALRGMILVWLGRFAQAEAAIAEAAEFANAATIVRFIPHLAATDMAYWRDDPSTGHRHAAVIRQHAERAQLPYLQVMAQMGFGRACSAARNFDAALASFHEALAYAQRTRAGLEYEPLLLSAVADATYRAGASDQAAALARDAIQLARQRTSRIAECQASIVCAAALFESGSPGARARAQPLLARAAELIEISGAAVLEPLLAHTSALIGRPQESPADCRDATAPS